MQLYRKLTPQEEHKLRKDARSNNINNLKAHEVNCPNNCDDGCFRCGGFGTIALYDTETAA